MMRTLQWRTVLRVAVMAAVVCASSCATVSKWQQERRAAQLQRRQNEEAADRNADSKADAAVRRKQTQHDASLRELTKELIARGDPNSLAAAALFNGLLSGFNGAVSLELATRAAGAAPTRADLVFLQLQLCENAPGCEAPALESRLRQLAPDNGITWTYQLVRAAQSNNGPDWKLARRALSQSTHIELYWNRIVSQLATAAAGRAGFDFTSAAMELLRIQALFMPAFEPVSRACSVQDVQDTQVLAMCRKIAAAFQNADTTTFEAYGTSLAMRLWPAESPEGRQIGSERRVLSYRVELMTRNAQKINSPHAQQVLAGLIGRSQTEQTAYRALFVALGLAPDPPANWVEHLPGS